MALDHYVTVTILSSRPKSRTDTSTPHKSTVVTDPGGGVARVLAPPAQEWTQEPWRDGTSKDFEAMSRFFNGGTNEGDPGVDEGA